MTSKYNPILKIKGIDQSIGLDCSGANINYLSHAHSDHLFNLNGKKVICSEITADLANIEQEKILDYKQFSNLKLYNSGHILGSTQLKLSTEEFGELNYTADFKLRDGLTTKGAQIVECDCLIVDGTYGAYDVKFKEPEQIFLEMKRWAIQNKNCNIVWGAYRIGKAQEIIKFLNEYLNVVPIVSKEISKICQIYKRYGIKLEYIDASEEEARKILNGQFHAVLEFNHLKEEFLYELTKIHRKKTLGALVTGWAEIYKKETNNIKMFGLSDHADFEQILQYCKESNAKEVYVAFGENKKTAKRLKNQNINAKAIEEFKIKKEEKVVSASIGKKQQLKQLTLDLF
ncbi:MAG: MBL fold metallo-hydrolase [Candidatus Micrarchaeota archaeon]|nr:MBL fold metallo-hydrolase [Candidatus Micrarchaeota archaeon]